MENELSWIYISESDPGPVFETLQEMEFLKLAGRGTDWKAGQSLLTALHPAMALLDLGEGEEGLRHLGKWSALYPKTLFFCTSAVAQPALIVRAMRAGAREFFLPGSEAEEIRRAIAAARRRLEGGTEQAPRAKIICCFGVKGGLGTTTLAANLAAAAAHYAHRRVLLIDNKLQLGNAALFLDLQPRITLLQILENLATLEVSRLQSTLARHSSGLYFVAGPENMEEADAITAEALGQILDLLRPEFDLILIDSDDHFDEVTIRALDEADTILTIAQLDLSTLYNLKRTLALFQRMGYQEDKIALVLNRYPAKLNEEQAAIEKSINQTIAFRMPFQENGVLIESINVGEPIVLSRPRHPFSQQVQQLAQAILAGEPAPATAPARAGTGLIKRWTRRKE